MQAAATANFTLTILSLHAAGGSSPAVSFRFHSDAESELWRVCHRVISTSIRAARDPKSAGGLSNQLNFSPAGVRVVDCALGLCGAAIGLLAYQRLLCSRSERVGLNDAQLVVQVQAEALGRSSSMICCAHRALDTSRVKTTSICIMTSPGPRTQRRVSSRPASPEDSAAAALRAGVRISPRLGVTTR